MFPRRYFAGRYFAPRFWPPTGDAPPQPEPEAPAIVHGGPMPMPKRPPFMLLLID